LRPPRSRSPAALRSLARPEGGRRHFDDAGLLEQRFLLDVE
jgi:hypothetical protein